MRNPLLAMFAVLVAGVFVLASCSGESSNANAGNEKAEADNVEVAQKDDHGHDGHDHAGHDHDGHGHDGHDHGSATAQPAPEGPSAERYAAILTEIQELQKGAVDQASTMRVVAEIETLFKDFLKQYPDSYEAQDANFQLGILYVSIARPAEGIPYLTKFLQATEGEHNDKIGYSHYYLAEAFKGADKFDKAKTHYQRVLDEYPTLNPQLVAMCQQNIRDMDTLKRLSIGSEPIPIEVVGLDGKKISLNELKGRVVLIDFWATWCRPCIAEMPNVIDIHKTYRDQGFEIVGISLDRDKGALQRYISQNNMDWPQFFDGKTYENKVAVDYKVRAIPTTYLLDREGKIRYRSLRGDQLKKAVAELIKEKA